MQKSKKYYLQLLLLLLCFSAILGSLATQRASAEVQEKYPYLIKVNRAHNTITVYEKDDKGEYKLPVKAMICSVGTNGLTVKGTYQTKAKYRWKLLMGNVWGQYSTRIVGGILFHSVYYYENGNPASLATKEYNKLGTAASHGCIRLTVEDAKWIYDHCAVGTTVVIYDNKKSPGPLGKPEAMKITSDIKWDPTDPDKNNPYYQVQQDKTPQITGIKNKKTAWNKEVDLLKGVKATTYQGKDITSSITIKGKVNYSKPGKYKVTYTVKDDAGRSISKSATVTVESNKVKPDIIGVQDKIIGPDVRVDKEFALADIKASCAGVNIHKNKIEVSINQINETLYHIKYQVSVGNGPKAKAEAKYMVDNECPDFTGIRDLTIEAGEYPSYEFLMANVTVRDNYSKADNIKVKVIVKEISESSYQVTYEATDEVGNMVIELANIYN